MSDPNGNNETEASDEVKKIETYGTPVQPVNVAQNEDTEMKDSDALPEPEDKSASQTTPQRASASSGWLSWVSKTPFTDTQVAPQTESKPEPMETDVETQTSIAAGPTSIEDQSSKDKASVPQQQSSSSWFPLWGGSAQASKVDDAPDPIEVDTTETGQTDAVNNDTESQPKESTPGPAPKVGSTWAFWSKESPKKDVTGAQPESGEIAVIGEGSESHPRTMPEKDVSGPKPKDGKDSAEPQDIPQSSKSSWRKTKRLRPASLDAEPVSPSPSGASTPTNIERVPTPQRDPNAPPRGEAGKFLKESKELTKVPPNLLLPSFTSTYQMKENPSILKQVAQFLLRTSQPPPNHVFRVHEPPKIRKAIAIGVHGLFPATYLRPMIGQPTGTSLRFASLCADAIRKWADDHGCADCEIEKVALEGEGKIGERVENLWRLMLNWITHIRSADLIIIASHSQGVPVSIMLLEKLIDLGIITNAKIGVCAMAGVALGPFPEYKSSILTGSAAELWEFGDPQSNNSQRFESALKRVLEYGARITFIGSIDDQLVPMEVSLLNHI